jgi:hypothetical protein
MHAGIRMGSSNEKYCGNLTASCNKQESVVTNVEILSYAYSLDRRKPEQLLHLNPTGGLDFVLSHYMLGKLFS